MNDAVCCKSKYHSKKQTEIKELSEEWLVFLKEFQPVCKGISSCVPQACTKSTLELDY